MLRRLAILLAIILVLMPVGNVEGPSRASQAQAMQACYDHGGFWPELAALDACGRLQRATMMLR